MYDDDEYIYEDLYEEQLKEKHDLQKKAENKDTIESYDDTDNFSNDVNTFQDKESTDQMASKKDVYSEEREEASETYILPAMESENSEETFYFTSKTLEKSNEELFDEIEKSSENPKAIEQHVMYKQEEAVNDGFAYENENHEDSTVEDAVHIQEKDMSNKSTSSSIKLPNTETVGIIEGPPVRASQVMSGCNQTVTKLSTSIVTLTFSATLLSTRLIM